MSKIGDTIREWRMQHGRGDGYDYYSLRYMAECCGISPSYLCEVENGKRLPSIKMLVEIAAFMEKDLEELYTILCKDRLEKHFNQ